MNNPPEVIESVRKRLEQHRREFQWLSQQAEEFQTHLTHTRSELEKCRSQVDILEDWLDAQ